jgi:IS30 family transposase
MEHRQKRTGWHQLTQNDRDRMEALLDMGETQREIAKILKVNEGTISRERKRQCKNGRYDAATAQHKACVERSHSKYQGMKIEGNKELKAHIILELEKKRSPDEIAGRMKREKMACYASKNAIYKWLYSVYGERYCHLLCTKRKRKRKQKKKTQRTMIPNRKSIYIRPLGATNQTRYRHYEADTIVAPKKSGNTHGIAIATERKTKFLLATKIPSLSPKEMTAAVNGFAEDASILSMTMDNGIENKEHESWDVDAFFADPHSPWQKPMIENEIGLLRRWYFKKGTDWSLVTEDALQEAVTFLNHKYRKSLGYQSAFEVASAHGIIKTKETKKLPESSCN